MQFLCDILVLLCIKLLATSHFLLFSKNLNFVELQFLLRLGDDFILMFQGNTCLLSAKEF